MRRRLRFIAAFAAALAAAWSVPDAARATGTWNGQNTLHVPTSWCVVRGSQAEIAPNVAGDTATDDVIWRRHERPTDFVYVNQSGITFRSAINNAWTILDFPRINDPDTTLGVQGDMRGENVNTAGVEFNTLINNCDTEYNNIGRAGIGITMVNANLFHDAGGNYIGIVGWGGCTRVGTTCSTPFDGRVVVVDNHYLHPSVPVRTWPNGLGPFGVTDSHDIDAGHEMGHSLGLPHRTGPTNLMNAILTDNDGNGDIDNAGLDATEIAALRGNAMNVPGLEQDPPGVIVPASVVAHRIPDQVREYKGAPAYLDVASVRVTLDERKREVGITTQLFGLLPKKTKEPTYWFLVDSDGEKTGAGPEALARLGLGDVKFAGADLVARATVRGGRVVGEVWNVAQGTPVAVTGGFQFELQTLVMYPLYATRPKGRMLDGVPVHNLIGLKLSTDLVRAQMGSTLRVQATAGEGRQRVADTLGDGGRFVLERPSFPHCFPQEDAPPGGQVKVKLEGLKPGAVIHGLIGPRLIFRGETDGNGGGTITLDIPKDTTPGLHLVTVGIDKTALTADCVVNVLGQK
ncbi:MAG TPA: hypothetical protein VN923_15485, partial [Thermoanaerobaculia bacterium]|nr:hypothetical protein [Thermoanaerobaculia bacterium]